MDITAPLARYIPRHSRGYNCGEKQRFAALSSAAIVLSTVYIPALQPVFKTVSLGGGELLVVLTATLAVPLVSAIIMLVRHGK